MSSLTESIVEPDKSRAKLRLWPAWSILLVQAALLAFTWTGQINNVVRFIAMMLGPLTCLLFFLFWWLFLSRAPAKEKTLVSLVWLTVTAITVLLSDPSMYVALFIYGIPLTMLIITLGETLVGPWSTRRRIRLISCLLVLGWSSFTLLRLNGFVGSYLPEFAWRFSPTAEQSFLEDLKRAPATIHKTIAKEPIVTTEADWPGFHGADRDSRVRLGTVSVDWNTNPPRERWRIKIGPGWSSFAIVSQFLFTQEQRGEDECVVCYDANSGEELWKHADRTRFSEVVAGPGPRATPTIAEGMLYTCGATGIINCLDPTTGRKIWSRDTC